MRSSKVPKSSKRFQPSSSFFELFELTFQKGSSTGSLTDTLGVNTAPWPPVHPDKPPPMHVVGLPCAPSKLRLAFRAVERAAYGTAAPHIHLWGSPGGKAVWNSSQRRSCGPFGPFWARLGPFGPFWALFGPCLPLWAFVGPFWPVRAFLGVFLETFGKCALIASKLLDSPRFSSKTQETPKKARTGQNGPNRPKKAQKERADLCGSERSTARKLADLCGSELSRARKLAELCGSEVSAAQVGNFVTFVDRSSAQRRSETC